MRTIWTLLLVLATTPMAAAGCDGGLQVHGAAAADGKLAVRWGEAGRGLVFGEGQADHGEFWVSVPDRPPAAAFEAGVAIGELVLLEDGASVRLGAPLREVQGVSPGLVLIYRDDDALAFEDFPVGLSCALRDESGLTPARCGDLTLRF